MDRAQERMADAMRRRPGEDPADRAGALVPGAVAPQWPHPPIQQPPRERVASLVRTIETDILPRLARAHRLDGAVVGEAQTVAVDEALVRAFVLQVLDESDDRAHETVAGLRGRGLSIEGVFLDLLTPAARRLGVMWEDDCCLFSDVTLAVGRLHRLMRSLSSDFTDEASPAPDGRRVLLCAPHDEQHTFGLAMVAEFFRRSGWDVAAGAPDAAVDPLECLTREWFDVVGFSIGGESRVEWLRQTIEGVRRRSRNRAIGVLVGGPAFLLDAAHAQSVGADALALDAREAPLAAERLMAERRRRL